MAGMMDMALLVVDAEKTDRDIVRRGYEQLRRGGAEIACIFNKTRSHVPRWIIQGEVA